MSFYLARLGLSNFRSHKNLVYNFEPGVQAFIGPNGSGKTNILESIVFLSQGQSFRFAHPREVIQWEQSQSLIHGRIYRKGLEFDLACQIEGARKLIRKQGKSTTWSMVQKEFPVVLFSPESLDAIKGSPDQRRNLVDEIVQQVYPQGPQILAANKKAYKQKASFLKSLVENSGKEPKINRDFFDSLNQLFLTATVDLAWARGQILHRIKPLFQKIAFELFLKETPVFNFIPADVVHEDVSSNLLVDIEYWISDSKENFDSKEILREKIAQRMRQLQDAEFSSGRCLVGAQKHDIQIHYRGKNSRIFCSQGQQRALILALKMAQIVYHGKVHEISPLLLLDDVLSELDFQRQQALVAFLHVVDSQIFITSTELPRDLNLGFSGMRVFEMKKGNT